EGKPLVFWAAGVLAFFSVSATKLPHYALPAIPALALLAGRAGPPRTAGETRLVAWTAAVLGALFFVAGAAGAARVESPALLLGAVGALAAIALLSLVLPLAVSTERRWPFAAHAVAAAGLIAVVMPSSLERG